jgi:hypothetical protein
MQVISTCEYNVDPHIKLEGNRCISAITPNNIRILCYTSIPCMQIIVEFTHKKTKNIGHFGWISDKVSTAQSIFDQCPFRFALHRTKGTRIFYRLVDVYSNDLYVHLCIGSNCTDTTIPLQFYVGQWSKIDCAVDTLSEIQPKCPMFFVFLCVNSTIICMHGIEV